jgi:hypothetical protein
MSGAVQYPFRGRPLLCDGRRGAVGLAFASYGAHDARPNMRSTSEKHFEDTIGRQQS